MAQTIDEVWADFEADGVTPLEPNKLQIRRTLKVIQAIASTNGMVTYTNKAVMDADLTQEDGQAALLWADPVEENNYPTVWVYDDGTNTWLEGIDRIEPVKITADGAMAIATPLAAATDVLAGDVLGITFGLDIGGSQSRIVESPVYAEAMTGPGNGVFLGSRLDGDFEIMGEIYRIVRSPYVNPVTNEFDQPISLGGSDGYPLGGLTPDQEADVEALIGSAGGGDAAATLKPVKIVSGAIHEYGATGLVEWFDPAPYVMSDPVTRDAQRTIAITNRPYAVTGNTAVAVHRDLNIAMPTAPELVHIFLVIGQSNAASTGGLTISDGIVVPVYPNHVLKNAGLDVRAGMPSDGSSSPDLDPASIVGFDALVSMLSANGACGVTICEGAGPEVVRQVDEAFSFKPTCLFGVFALGGAAYDFIKKGTNTYDNAIIWAEKVAELVRLAGKTPVFSGIIVEHGEADGPSTTYAADCIEWRTDYNADLKPLGGPEGEGQDHDIPFIFVQPSGFSQGNHLSGLAMVDLMLDHPTQFTVACPAYWLAYTDQGDLYVTDRIHYSAKGQVRAGRDYVAAAYLRQAFGGPEGNKPGAFYLDPADVTWDGTTLTVGANVPTAPIVLSAGSGVNQIPDPGDYGFKATDGSGDLPVDTVTVTGGGTKLAFTFTRAATTSRKLQYALTGYPVGTKTLANQPRGCVRDSSPIPNWLLHYEIAF